MYAAPNMCKSVPARIAAYNCLSPSTGLVILQELLAIKPLVQGTLEQDKQWWYYKGTCLFVSQECVVD